MNDGRTYNMHQGEDVVPDAFPMVAHHGAVHHNEHLSVLSKTSSPQSSSAQSSLLQSSSSPSWAPWGRPQRRAPGNHRHHHHVPRRHTSIIIMSRPPSKKHHSPNPHNHLNQDNHLNPVFPGGRRPNFGSTGRSARSTSGSDPFKTTMMIVMKSTIIWRMVTF